MNDKIRELILYVISEACNDQKRKACSNGGVFQEFIYGDAVKKATELFSGVNTSTDKLERFVYHLFMIGDIGFNVIEKSIINAEMNIETLDNHILDYVKKTLNRMDPK